MLVGAVLLASIVAVRDPDQRHAEMINEYITRQTT